MKLKNKLKVRWNKLVFENYKNIKNYNLILTS